MVLLTISELGGDTQPSDEGFIMPEQPTSEIRLKLFRPTTGTPVAARSNAMTANGKWPRGWRILFLFGAALGLWAFVVLVALSI